jgi:hypothetical protein
VDMSVPADKLEEVAAPTANEKALTAEFARRVLADTLPSSSKDSVDAISQELLTNIAQMKAEAREEVRQELLADPEVAGAKSALERIKAELRPFMLENDAKEVLSGKETEITKLQNENAELTLRVKALESEQVRLVAVAKEAGYR